MENSVQICPECKQVGLFAVIRRYLKLKKTGEVKEYQYKKAYCGHCEYLKRKERTFKQLLKL